MSTTRAKWHEARDLCDKIRLEYEAARDALKRDEITEAEFAVIDDRTSAEYAVPFAELERLDEELAATGE